MSSCFALRFSLVSQFFALLEVVRVCGGDGGGGGNGSGDCGDGGGGDGDDGDGINFGLVLHYFGFDFRSFGLHLGSILVPFWIHFGSILAPFWLHFGSILGSEGGSLEGPRF